MKKLTVIFCVALMAVGAADVQAQKNKKKDASGPKTEIQNPQEMEIKDNVSYLLGFSSGMQLSGIPYQFEVESFVAGVRAALEGKPSGFEPAEAQKILTDWQASLQKKSSEKALENKVKGKQFMAENLQDPAIKQTESGLQYKVLVEGTGIKPKATDKVLVHYTGKLLDGTVFDSSVARGEPISFPLNGVIAGWTEGLQLMPEGSKYMLYIPSELAYGDSDNGPIPAGSTLIFEVELLKVNP